MFNRIIYFKQIFTCVKLKSEFISILYYLCEKSTLLLLLDLKVRQNVNIVNYLMLCWKHKSLA